LKTDAGLPEWLKASIARQKALWNRLAWLCRYARRRCSPAPVDELRRLVRETILPTLDQFNRSLGRPNSKQKIGHPDKLKVEEPEMGSLWSLIGSLRMRIEQQRPVPDGLMETLMAFAERFAPDYGPINEFQRTLNDLANREADKLGLLWYERLAVIGAFQAVLKTRGTNQSAFCDGWPQIRYSDDPRAGEWSLQFPMKRPDISSESLETGRGVPGLSFGPPLPAPETGHPAMVGSATRRQLREAEIRLPGEKGERQIYRFGVLQHRPLPAGAHIKGWKLVAKDRALWLCLTVEWQRPAASAQPMVAGLDIGWRRTEEGVRFGTLYGPGSGTVRELVMDFQRSPRNQGDRVPFRIDLGPTRWERRSLLRLLPDWKPGDPVPGAFELKRAAQASMDARTQALKLLLKRLLGERVPAWVERAGRRGLRKLAAEFSSEPAVARAISQWEAQDIAAHDVYALLSKRAARRIEDGHREVAHDVCRFLKDKGITRLAVETNFLAKVAKAKKNDAPESLRQGAKYRHFAAVGRFLTNLKHIAVKYGLVVEAHNTANTTRICHRCNHLNPASKKEAYPCEGCFVTLRQDENAAINLSRSVSDPAPDAGKWKEQRPAM
jgi:hypothetical protein